MKRKIYLASSWRNTLQPNIVVRLRELGHEVYDFRNPEPGNHGFAWHQARENYLKWTVKEYIENLKTHSKIKESFKFDMDALIWCDTCVLLLPCGRSAHLEAGYCIGAKKGTFVYVSKDKFEPDLMYLMANEVHSDIDELLTSIGNAND